MLLPDILQSKPTDLPATRHRKRNARSAVKRMLRTEARLNPTPAEVKMRDALAEAGLGKFTFQAIIKGFMPDFWSARHKLIIEVDGKVHDGQREYDKWRQGILCRGAIRMLRFTNSEVLSDIDRCIALVRRTCDKPPRGRKTTK